MRFNVLNLGFSVILWVASTIAVLYVAFLVFFGDPGTLPLIGAMFARPNVFERLPILAIFAVFGWALAALAFVGRQVWQQHSAVGSVESAFLSRDMRKMKAFPALPDAARAFRRASFVAKHYFEGGRDLQEVLSGVSAIDASTLGTRFTWLHVYAWLLPVLGFIGTASGMSSAILGFSRALEAAKEISIQTTVTTLSTFVIPGLSAAFETTVLALTASLVIYTCTNALQRTDQQALEKLDYLSLDILAATPSGGLGDTLRVLQQIAGSLANMPQHFEGASEELKNSAKMLQEAGRSLEIATFELRASISLPYNVTITRGDRR